MFGTLTWVSLPVAYCPLGMCGAHLHILNPKINLHMPNGRQRAATVLGDSFPRSLRTSMRAPVGSRPASKGKRYICKTDGHSLQMRGYVPGVTSELHRSRDVHHSISCTCGSSMLSRMTRITGRALHHYTASAKSWLWFLEK